MDERRPHKQHDTPSPPAQVARTQQPKPAPPADPRHAPAPVARLSRPQAADLAQSVKDWTLVASLTGFVVFGGLVLSHTVVSGQTSGDSNTQQSSPLGQPGGGSSNPSGDGYFNQQGGFGFGSGGSNQAPVSGTHSS